ISLLRVAGRILPTLGREFFYETSTHQAKRLSSGGQIRRSVVGLEVRPCRRIHRLYGPVSLRPQAMGRAARGVGGACGGGPRRSLFQLGASRAAASLATAQDPRPRRKSTPKARIAA